MAVTRSARLYFAACAAWLLLNLPLFWHFMSVYDPCPEDDSERLWMFLDSAEVLLGGTLLLVLVGGLLRFRGALSGGSATRAAAGAGLLLVAVRLLNPMVGVYPPSPSHLHGFYSLIGMDVALIAGSLLVISWRCRRRAQELQ